MKYFIGLFLAMVAIGCEPKYKQQTVTAEMEEQQKRAEDEVAEGEKVWQKKQRR